MRKAATTLAMASALMSYVDMTHEIKSKYPTGGGRTDHGKYLPAQFKETQTAEKIGK